MSASTASTPKPVLDEPSFQQLLEAAYVVQQHKDTLSAKNSDLDPDRVLSEIAELQSRAKAGGLDLATAGKLITEKLLQLAGASGVSLSLIDNGFLNCVAESGAPAKIPGCSLASHSLVATERLKAGEVFDSRDSRSDIRLDVATCHGLGVGSLIAAPVLRFGELAGLIETRWARARAFDETSLLACRMMASLATGILERSTGVLEKSASPPEVVLPPKKGETASSVTEPQVETRSAFVENPEPASTSELAETQASERQGSEAPRSEEPVLNSSESTVLTAAAASSDENVPAVADSVAQSCRVCGRPLSAQESFCGYCSMPRIPADPSRKLQSKWASLWFIQRAHGALAEKEETADHYIEPANSAEVHLESVSELEQTSSAPVLPPPELPLETSALTAVESTSHFSYFEPTPAELGDESEIDLFSDVSLWRRILRTGQSRLRAKDVVLILIAAVLTFGVISAWPRSNGQLTWFGSIVVRMGLARPPVHRPTYAGNPDINVWVDERTSVYYCPGADLYGNTANGYFATQEQAQTAQIQPASGLACQ
jgi:hypothetical protein